MTLEDAIVYYSESAKECRRKARIESNDYMDMKDSVYEAEQLAGWLNELKVLRERINAQPEIIRCTECKHYREYDSKYVENAVVVQCMADRYPISGTIPDGWFCAGAERKDDE